MFIIHRLQPLVGSTFLDVLVIGQMLHPAIGGGSVPVLHPFGDGNYNTRFQFHGLFAPFLIPAAAGHANQYLDLLVVDMPVVAAAELEGDIVDATAYIGQIAGADEILSVRRVGLPLGPGAAQGITLAVQPGAESIDKFLAVAQVALLSLV